MGVGDGMRKQYHIRNSERGLLAWDVDRLLRLTSEQKPVDLPLEKIRELDEIFWFSSDGDTPTCRRVADHTKLINETSLDHLIIIDPEGHVMDGISSPVLRSKVRWTSWPPSNQNRQGCGEIETSRFLPAAHLVLSGLPKNPLARIGCCSFLDAPGYRLAQ
jgi:hypothetical protein